MLRRARRTSSLSIEEMNRSAMEAALRAVSNPVS